MAKTAIQLVRELGKRFNEYIPCVASGGTTTTLVAPRNNIYFPEDNTQLNAWFYGPLALATDTVNRGLEPRATTWTASTSTFTFWSGFAWLTAPTVNEIYDCHLKYEHTRLLAAINDAIGELNLYCTRPVQDNTVTTNDTDYVYGTGTVLWSRITQVLIQSVEHALGNDVPPYMNADVYGYEVKHFHTTSFGGDNWVLYFKSKPPSGRRLQIIGESYWPSLSADSDILAITGANEFRILRWIMDWAAYTLNDWTAEGVPQSEVAAYRQKAYDKLQYALQELKDFQNPVENSRIVTPMNDALLRPYSRGRFGQNTPH